MSEARITALKDLLAHDPNDTMLLFGLGSDYYELGQYAAAVQYFTRAVEVDPEYAAAYVRLAWAYERLQQPELARDTLTRGRGPIERSGDRNLIAEMEDLLDLL
jgi:tetratricopeptide (TPR) repeat protein